MSRRTTSSAADTLDHLASTHELSHLRRFKRKFADSNEYWEASQYLLYGGWTELIRQYFYESPDWSDGDAFSPMLIFPGEELGARRIEPVPLTYSPNLTVGDLVLRTAWVRDLSPRLVYLNSDLDSRIERVLKFVRRETSIPFDISKPPSVVAIDQMLLDLEGDPENVNTMNDNHDRGLTLIKLIEKITGSEGKFGYFKGTIHPKQELRNLFVRIDLGETHSLVQILNAIAHYLDAAWEWGDDSQIHITPCPGCGTIASLLSRD